MDISTIIKQYDFNLKYAHQLVADIPQEKMTAIPHPSLVNHPSFTIGHLVSGSAILAKYLGSPFEIPENWSDLFLRKGPGDPALPDPDSVKYPKKMALLNELEAQHAKVKALIVNTELDDLQSDYNWRYSSYMPTLLDVVTFLCINHEAMHLGQLAVWRRAMGMDSALAKL